jgi:hypothetical protein
MATKSNKKGPLGQESSHMGNPMKAFREGGQKKIDAYRKGGYNTPINGMPKKAMGGGDDPVKSYTSKQPKLSSVTMANPYAKTNPIREALSYKPSSITRPSTTAPVVAPAPVSVTPASSSVAPVSFKEKKKALKEQGKLDKLERKLDMKKAKDENLRKQYETGERRAETAADKIDRAVKIGETVIGGMDAVNKFRQPPGGGDPFKRGGSVKPKASMMKKKMGGGINIKKKK